MKKKILLPYVWYPFTVQEKFKFGWNFFLTPYPIMVEKDKPTIQTNIT